MTSPQKYAGVIPPIVTPMDDRRRVDTAGLERLVSHLIDGGVHGLFVLGTTGEGPSLDGETQRVMIEATCSLAARRTRVLVCISDTSFDESIRLAQFARDCGASAVVAAPPYYFPAGQPELLEYLQHLVPRLPLPLMLYNMPSMTKIHLEPDTVRRAFEIPGVIGMKDSSGSMIYAHHVKSHLAGRDDISLLLGAEELLAEAVLFGFDGGVCGGANVFPRLYVDLYNAAQRQDLSTTRQLHAKVLRVGQLLYGVGKHPSSTIKGIKCALSVLGLCGDTMAEPLHAFRETERAKITETLELLRRELVRESVEV